MIAVIVELSSSRCWERGTLEAASKSGWKGLPVGSGKTQTLGLDEAASARHDNVLNLSSSPLQLHADTAISTPELLKSHLRATSWDTLARFSHWVSDVAVISSDLLGSPVTLAVRLSPYPHHPLVKHETNGAIPPATAYFYRKPVDASANFSGVLVGFLAYLDAQTRAAIQRSIDRRPPINMMNQLALGCNLAHSGVQGKSKAVISP